MRYREGHREGDMGTEPRRVTKVYRQTGKGRRQLKHGLFQKRQVVCPVGQRGFSGC